MTCHIAGSINHQEWTLPLPPLDWPLHLPEEANQLLAHPELAAASPVSLPHVCITGLVSSPVIHSNPDPDTPFSGSWGLYGTAY